MQRIETQAGLTEEEMQELEAKLLRDGLRKVDQLAKLAPNQYQIAHHTGDSNSFGDVKKYTVRWCSQ